MVARISSVQEMALTTHLTLMVPTFARLSVLANDELLAEMMPAVLFHGLAVTNFLACYFFAH